MEFSVKSHSIKSGWSTMLAVDTTVFIFLVNVVRSDNLETNAQKKQTLDYSKVQ